MPTLTPPDWRDPDLFWWLLFWAVMVGVALITATMVFVWWYWYW